MKQLALGVRLRADATFQSFAPGDNAEAVSALRDMHTTPVWLWGGAGSGKTHLLQAVCAAAGQAAAYFPLRAVPSSDAGIGASPGAANHTPPLPAEALVGFANCRVLGVDDLDAVAGDLAWERALFRLFNEATELGTRLIFAADAAPRHLDWCLEDWRSRAAACVVYQLRELDDAGRVEALRLRAAQRGLQLPPETSEYLLRRMPRDLSSLYAVLDRLDEASLIAQRRLTVPFIREVLETLAKKTP